MWYDTWVLVYRWWGLELDYPMDEEAILWVKHVIPSCQLSYCETACEKFIRFNRVSCCSLDWVRRKEEPEEKNWRPLVGLRHRNPLPLWRCVQSLQSVFSFPWTGFLLFQGWAGGGIHFVIPFYGVPENSRVLLDMSSATNEESKAQKSKKIMQVVGRRAVNRSKTSVPVLIQQPSP